MKQLAMLFWVICSCYTLSAQVKITVFNSENGEPVPYANVCTQGIENNHKAYTVTKLNGEASIKNQEAIISISSIGFITLIDTLASNIKEKIYSLKPSQYELNDVVITGQNKPIPVDKSIYDVHIISSEEIALQSAQSLSELLNNELTVKIDNDPSLGSSVNIQGISGQNVKILVDGVPVIGRMGGNIDLSQIGVNNIDHIEIIEGPMSVMYGTNALAGVINIITAENKYAKLSTSINTYYESVGIYNVNGNLYLKNKNHSVGITGARNFSQGYSSNKDARDLQWKPKEQYNVGAHYIYEKNKLKLKYKIDGFKERLLYRDEPQSPYYEEAHDIWFYTNRLNNSLMTNYDFNAFSSFNLLLSYSYYKRIKNKYLKDLTTLETTLTGNSTDQDTSVFDAIVARGVYNFDNADKKVSWQLGFDFNAESTFGKRLLNQNEDIGDYALFTSLQWKANEKLIIQPAVRAAYNTRYNAPLTPSINFKYNLQKTTFRLSYSYGFRAPSLKELYLHFYDSNHQIEGNEDLKAENSNNYNFSVTHKNTIADKPFDIKLSGFYNHIFNKITLVQVSEENGIHYKYQNISEFESLGLTFRANIQPTRFIDFSIGISEIGTKDDVYKDDPNYVSAFTFSTNFNSTLTAKLLKNTATVAVFYKYSGPYPTYYYNNNDELALGNIDAFDNLNITFSKSFFKRSLKLSTGIKNVFDNVTINSPSGGGGAHSSGSSALVGWGRTFFVELKYNFSKY